MRTRTCSVILSFILSGAALAQSTGFTFQGQLKDAGSIADCLHDLLPDAVALDQDGKPTGIDYSRITVLAVKAIKEQQVSHANEIAAIRAEARAEADALREHLKRLEARLSAQSR